MANIELDGTNKKIKVDSGDLTLDVPGDIILDADGANVTFKDGGTSVLDLSNSSTDAVLTVSTQDKDLIIKGDDGGSAITAATFDMSDAGTLALNHDLRIADAGYIGSASDSDAIAIASNGVVTFSQAPVFPDGSLNIADIDLDGGTDINAAIVDADLFLIDDGAGGTMRKTAASRIKTYAGHTFAGCLLYKTSEQSNISANSDVVVTWEAEVYDTDSFHDTSSNTSRITIPAAFNGMKARFAAHVTMASVSDGQHYELRVFKNGAANTDGATHLGKHKAGADADLIISGITDPITVATNDYFECIVSTPESDVDVLVSANGNNEVYFAGFSCEICAGS